LNDATEWLQYAYNALQLLAELVHERGTVDAHRMPIMLGRHRGAYRYGYALRDAGASADAVAASAGGSCIAGEPRLTPFARHSGSRPFFCGAAPE
jgi:hypothetical protein